MVVQQNRSKEKSDHQMIDSRLEKARETLMAGLDTLRRETLSDKEADAVSRSNRGRTNCPPRESATWALIYPGSAHLPVALTIVRRSIPLTQGLVKEAA